MGVWAREPGDAWGSSLRSPGPSGRGAVSGATASWRLHSARRGVARPGPAHRCMPASVACLGTTGRLLGTALSGQTFWTIPHHLRGQNKPMALCQTKGCPTCPDGHGCFSGTPRALWHWTHRAFSLPEMHSPLLPRPEGPEEDTQKNRPAHSQFLPMANLHPPHP